MAKKVKSIVDQVEGHISKKSKFPKSDISQNVEESKFDSQLVSGHSTLKAEGGLIP